jgi:A/G-specific adenine glycosylase
MTFSERIIAWQRVHGRHDLPWQRTRDPYRIWLAEIMLQQTQVATVVPFFRRFLERCPDVTTLASADIDDVMEAWAGLGYYSRARNLHRCAQAIVTQYGGTFPRSAAELAGLPGIGRSTAAAIAAFAHGASAAILDGNVKRVLARHFGVAGEPASAAVERELWRLSVAQLPAGDIEVYTQGLMDLGATVCLRGRPHCDACPLRTTCAALRDGRVDELPHPRRVRERPLRAATLALISDDDGLVLLERRTPAGIWGGLLSLPEFEADVSDEALIAAIDRRYGLSGHVVGRLAPLRHEFTHYSFLMTPCLLRATHASASNDSAALVWLASNQVDAAALPAPIRRLLHGIGRPPANTCAVT